MKKCIPLSVLVLAGSLSLTASPVITIIPSDGDISGVAGTEVGWGFAVTSDPIEWISFVVSVPVAESNPSVGFYSDFIGFQGGPVNNVLPPGSIVWTEPFDPSGIGLGSYTIDPAAATGAVDSGMIDVQYETFLEDPNLCPTCATGFGDALVPFTVTVTDTVTASATPEPSPLILVGLGGALLLAGRRRR